MWGLVGETERRRRNIKGKLKEMEEKYSEVKQKETYLLRIRQRVVRLNHVNVLRPQQTLRVERVTQRLTKSKILKI